MLINASTKHDVQSSIFLFCLADVSQREEPITDQERLMHSRRTTDFSFYFVGKNFSYEFLKQLQWMDQFFYQWKDWGLSSSTVQLCIDKRMCLDCLQWNFSCCRIALQECHCHLQAKICHHFDDDYYYYHYYLEFYSNRMSINFIFVSISEIIVDPNWWLWSAGGIE